jgi:hypothetical protein
MREPLTYHTEGPDADILVESFFREASEVLPAGGTLIFDVIEPGGPSLTGHYCVLARIRPYRSRPRKTRVRVADQE